MCFGHIREVTTSFIHSFIHSSNCSSLLLPGLGLNTGNSNDKQQLLPTGSLQSVGRLQRITIQIDGDGPGIQLASEEGPGRMGQGRRAWAGCRLNPEG